MENVSARHLSNGTAKYLQQQMFKQSGIKIFMKKPFQKLFTFQKKLANKGCKGICFFKELLSILANTK